MWAIESTIPSVADVEDGQQRRPYPPRTPLSVRSKMLRDYIKGMSGPEVAEKHNSTTNVLYAFMRSRKVKRRSRRKTDPMLREKIRAQRADGLTLHELAERYGLSRTCIFKIVGQGSGRPPGRPSR